jgi:hypothetical protein
LLTNGASPFALQQVSAGVGAGAGPLLEIAPGAGDRGSSGAAAQAGSNVAMVTEPKKLASTVLPQKITPAVNTVAPTVYGVQVNHEAMMSSVGVNLGGYDIMGNGMAFGVSSVCSDFNSSSFDLGTSMSTELPLQPGDKGCSMVQNKGEKFGVGLQNTMRDASYMKANGELNTHFEFSPKKHILSCDLSLVENDSFSHCPSIEEVIAFGGIPKPTSVVRSSARLGGQPNADMPQMEKAIKMASLRDESSLSGKFAIPSHSIILIPDSEIARRADRLGISLGKSAGEIGKSVKGLKLIEEERILTILEKKNNDNENMKEGLETLVLSKVSNLSEDLVDEDDTTLGLDDHLEHLKPVVKVKKSRQRKIYDTINIRKSTRKRIKKQW